MDAKLQLENWCREHYLAPPTYRTVRDGLLWISEVTVGMLTARSDPQPKKRLAENQGIERLATLVGLDQRPSSGMDITDLSPTPEFGVIGGNILLTRVSGPGMTPETLRALQAFVQVLGYQMTIV